MLKKSLKVSMTNNLKIVKGICVGASFFVASLALAQSANAVVYDWEFRNEDGNIGLVPFGVVAGEVEFNDFDVFPGATDVSAIRLEINRVDGFDSPPSPPFFSDQGIELGVDLVPFQQGFSNEFDFDINLQIESAEFRAQTFDVIPDPDVFEELVLETTGGFGQSRLRQMDGPVTEYVEDIDGSTLSFSQQGATPVPFEINPTLGLLLVGGIFGSSRYLKHRKAVNK